MVTLLKALDSFEPMQNFIWECLNHIHNCLLVLLIIVPLVVGIVVIISVLHLSAKIPKILHRLYYPDLHCHPEPETNPIALVETHSNSAFVLQFLRKQHNEYYFQSASTSIYNLDSSLPQWILSTILYRFMIPYTKTSIERVLVLIPPFQSSASSLKNTSGILLKHGHPVGSPYLHKNLKTGIPTTDKSFNDSREIKVGNTPSLNKLSYLDLSLRKYWNSPQHLYKEKRPIHFKFLSDA